MVAGNGLQAGDRPTLHKFVLPKIKLNHLKTICCFEVSSWAGAWGAVSGW